MISRVFRNIFYDLLACSKIFAKRRRESVEDKALYIYDEHPSRTLTEQGNIAAPIHERFAVLGGVDLPDVPREPVRNSVISI